MDGRCPDGGGPLGYSLEKSGLGPGPLPHIRAVFDTRRK
ncbi:hypothetical protein RHECNPAF_430047 [Rhizobium etli CNPAF512]|nr:hypothetical protein RHECNPAF_430047 [Rhizobium etli CNPAF512]